MKREHESLYNTIAVVSGVSILFTMFIGVLILVQPFAEHSANQSWQCFNWENTTESAQLCTESCHYPYGLANGTQECSTVCNPVNITVPTCTQEFLVRNVSK